VEVIVPCQAVRSFPHAASFFSSMLVGTIVLLFCCAALLLCCFCAMLCYCAMLKNNCAASKIMLDFYVLLLYIDTVAVL
jgi:hypothetical protein